MNYQHKIALFAFAFLNVFLLRVPHVCAQDLPDSVVNILSGSTDTMELINAHTTAFRIQIKSSETEGLAHAQAAIRLARNFNAQVELYTIYDQLFQYCYSKGDYLDCIRYGDSCLTVATNLQDSIFISRIRSNLGAVYFVIGDYNNALKNYLLSLRYSETLDNAYKGSTIINIGMLYRQIGSDSLAGVYLKKALDIGKELGDTSIIVKAINNIALLKKGNKDYISSLAWFNRGILLAQNAGLKLDEADMLYNLTFVYLQMRENKKAWECGMRSLQLTLELGDEYGLAVSYKGLAKIAYEMGNYKLAASNLSKAEDISTKYNNYQVLVEVYRLWSELLEQKGNYKQSNRYIRKMLTYQDSVKKTQDHQKMSELQTRYFLDMKSREDSLQNLANARIYQMEMAQKEQQLKTQRIFSWGGVLLALLALLAAGSLYSAFKQKKKDNQIIAAQKALVEEKNREITDSITYAKRIQSAILPPQKKIKKHLQNSFILYKPKDIVAGDFYWLEPGEDSVLFAVADCTGHGVPGALVSVVCHNALNRAVREYGLSEPGKILDKAREIVVQEFEKSEEDIKDGMDISLCRLEIPGTKPGSPYAKTKTQSRELKLEWAGANNPLWLIRQNERGVPLLIETKPDKQPIGMTDNPQAFTTHRIALQEGDAIYIFSDGYADQFGGPGGKKFKLRAVRDMLLSIYNKPMEEQMHIIDERHEQWKTCPRQLEQVDDICILGVKISAQR